MTLDTGLSVGTVLIFKQIVRGYSVVNAKKHHATPNGAYVKLACNW